MNRRSTLPPRIRAAMRAKTRAIRCMRADAWRAAANSSRATAAALSARCSRFCAITARAARCLPAGDPATRDDSPTLCMHGSAPARRRAWSPNFHAPDADTLPVMWASLAAPCTSIAFPLFVGGTLPPVLAAGGEKPSADSPWWRFRKIQDLVAMAPERMAPIAWKHFRPLEAAMLERCAEVSRQARKLDPRRARNCSAPSWRRISCAS